MSSRRVYVPWDKFDVNEVRFSLGVDRSNKATITMVIGPACAEVAMVTPACVTNWPRVTGDGNFGTMWGPTDISQAKFSLDLTDADINGIANPNFDAFTVLMNGLDDKLLDFVHNNQLKILGRKNLSREEVKMLQIRTIRPKYDKLTGVQTGQSIQMTTRKFKSDGMGSRYERSINICDQKGAVVLNGTVSPGDVVASTAYANMVYTGVGGDKFGIHWSFEDISVVCQRSKLEVKTQVADFACQSYDFAQAYSQPMDVEVFRASQFSD